MNFGIDQFWKGVPAGELVPGVQKGAGSYARMWMAGREGDLLGDGRLSRPQEQSTWVLAAIDLVVRQITGVDLIWKATEEDEQALPPDRDRAAFWKAPGRTRAGVLSRGDVVELAGAWLLLKGTAFLVLDDTWLAAPGRGIRSPFLVARPDRMRPIEEGGAGGDLMGWEFTDGRGRREALIPEQVVCIRKANPFDELMGLAAYTAASTAAEADYASGRFARNVARSNGQKGEYITTDGGMPTPEQQEQIVAALREKKRRVAEGNFAPTFLAGGLKVEKPSVSSVDVAFVTQRIEHRHEIAAAFGVPMSFFDVKAAYSLGADSDSRQLLWGASMPLAVKLAHAFSRVEKMRSGKDLHAEHDWTQHPVMQAVMQQKLDAVAKLAERGVPMRDINQVLDLGLPRFLGDDVGFIPFGQVPMSEALGMSDTAEPAPVVEEPTVQNAFAVVARALQARNAAKQAKAIEITNNAESPAGSAPAHAQRTTAPAALSQEAGVVALEGGKPTRVSVEELIEAAKQKRANPHAAITLGARTGRTRLWNMHQGKRAPIERTMRSRLGKVFGRFRAEALAKLAQWGDAIGHKGSGVDAAMPFKSLPGAVAKAGGFEFILDLASMREAMKNGLRPVLQATLQKAGEELFAEVGKDDPFSMAPESAKAFLNLRENRIAGAGDEIFTQLTDSLAEGFDKGETMAELAGRVKETFAGASDSKATTIAATETAAAYSAARGSAMEQAGVTWKEWLTAKDDRVRAEHQEMDGVIVPLDQPFTLRDGTQMMHPADESGPAHHVINCRCISIAALKGPEEPAE